MVFQTLFLELGVSELKRSWVCSNCGNGVVSIIENPTCVTCMMPMLNSGYRVPSDLEEAENAITSLEADCAGLAAKCETIRAIYGKRIKQLRALCREYQGKAKTKEDIGVLNAAWILYANRGTSHELQNYLIPKLWNALEAYKIANGSPIFPPPEPEPRMKLQAQASHSLRASDLIITDESGKHVVEAEFLTEAEAEEIAYRINFFEASPASPAESSVAGTIPSPNSKA